MIKNGAPVVKRETALLNWIGRPAGHYGLLVVPLSVITAICFAWVVAQATPPAGTPASSSSGNSSVHGEITEHSELPFAPAPNLPKLDQAPVAVSAASAAASQTSTPQPATTAVSDLQAASAANPVMINAVHHISHKHRSN